jgi:hypothetical protein
MIGSGCGSADSKTRGSVVTDNLVEESYTTPCVGDAGKAGDCAPRGCTMNTCHGASEDGMDRDRNSTSCQVSSSRDRGRGDEEDTLFGDG